MAEELSREQIIEQQKQNCPFCKIVTGEIPSSKVYEDPVILAVADINPAAKGHVLVFPKEHYPIMPMMPPDVANHLFSKLKYISKGQREAMVTVGNTWLIANGGAAGQRSSHFMVHLIPRDPGDKLTELFGTKPAQIDPRQLEQLGNALTQNLVSAFKAPRPAAAPPQPAPPSADQKKRLAERLEADERLRTLLITDPQAFAEQAQKDPQLRQLLTGIDISTLSERLKQAYG